MVAVGVVVAVTAGIALTRDNSPSRQDTVLMRGATVMPFDQAKTMHHFVTNETGGVESVLAMDPNDSTQVELVRQHLKEEATRFAGGDFSDPAAIHGQDMPGLKALQAGRDRLSVEYGELPDGARITYASTDPQLVAAIHSWFGAQTSDHGEHAMSH